MVQKDRGDFEKPLFHSREEVELLSLMDQGKLVELSAPIFGENTVRIPRWSMRKAFQCGEEVSRIIATLYPNDISFLLQINWTKQATAHAQLYDIICVRVLDPVMRIICLTLEIHEKEKQEQLINEITPEDVMEIFCTIIEQEVNNERMEAILKKVERLLTEKFRLENVSLNVNEILEAASQKFLTDIPSNNSLSSVTTEK